MTTTTTARLAAKLVAAGLTVDEAVRLAAAPADAERLAARLAAKLVAAGLMEDVAARLAVAHAEFDPVEVLAAKLAADAPLSEFRAVTGNVALDQVQDDARRMGVSR